MLILISMTFTLMQGHSGSAKVKFQCWIMSTTKQATSIKLGEAIIYVMTLQMFIWLDPSCLWTEPQTYISQTSSVHALASWEYYFAVSWILQSQNSALFCLCEHCCTVQGVIIDQDDGDWNKWCHWHQLVKEICVCARILYHYQFIFHIAYCLYHSFQETLFYFIFTV